MGMTSLFAVHTCSFIWSSHQAVKKQGQELLNLYSADRILWFGTHEWASKLVRGQVIRRRSSLYPAHELPDTWDVLVLGIIASLSLPPTFPSEWRILGLPRKDLWTIKANFSRSWKTKVLVPPEVGAVDLTCGFQEFPDLCSIRISLSPHAGTFSKTSQPISCYNLTFFQPKIPSLFFSSLPCFKPPVDPHPLHKEADTLGWHYSHLCCDYGLVPPYGTKVIPTSSRHGVWGCTLLTLNLPLSSIAWDSEPSLNLVPPRTANLWLFKTCSYIFPQMSSDSMAFLHFCTLSHPKELYTAPLNIAQSCELSLTIMRLFVWVSLHAIIF
jgi:hypothetical protein